MKIVREALPFAGAVVGVSAVLGWLVHPWAALVGLPPLAFVLWFFRDPERSTPRVPGLLISPADGRIIQAGPRRVSVFMNVFNVHVCRAPSNGVLESVKHHPGRFLAAFREEASECNERVSIVLAGGGVRVTFTLVAGLIARRIVCKVAPGEELSAGQRVGLIRFGSRVDVDLPPGYSAAVACGDHVVAGETVIARDSEAPAGGPEPA